MRKVTDPGLILVKHYEGFSNTAYLCPAAHWTIGYGAIWGTDGARVTEDHPDITEVDGGHLLKRDLSIAERGVLRLIEVSLTDNQFNALCSFVYNLGSGSLQASTLRRRLNKGDYEGAANEFPRWVYAGGRKLKGLIRRRDDEKLLFLA